MRTFFDPDAPWTVRAGALCLAAVSVYDCLYSLLIAWSSGGLSLGLWPAVLKPLIGLVAGLAWAWGIGHMLGVFYWIWVVTMILVVGGLAVLSLLSSLGLGPQLAGHTWTVGDGIGMALVGAAFVLLLARPSLRAYWNHGRLFPRRPTEIA